MAKALYGHLATHPTHLAELGALRRRVRELEGDLAGLRAENARLRAELASSVPVVDELLSLETRQEPALT